MQGSAANTKDPGGQSGRGGPGKPGGGASPATTKGAKGLAWGTKRCRARLGAGARAARACRASGGDFPRESGTAVVRCGVASGAGADGGAARALAL